MLFPWLSVTSILINMKYVIRDGKSVADSPPAVKKSRTEAVTMATLDADDPVDSSDSDGDDSDDDTAVLTLAQLIFRLILCLHLRC